MSYQTQSDTYRDMANRGRYEMCAREQAHLTYANDPDAANQSLAYAVIAGDTAAIDALIAAVCVGPNGAVLDSDPDLMAAMQAAWPNTALGFVNNG